MQLEAAEIVARARGKLGESQRKFALRLGTAQSLICKYEMGAVSPPAQVLIQCMNLLEMDLARDMSVEGLADLIRRKLVGDEMGPARTAVANLVICMQRPARGRRRTLRR